MTIHVGDEELIRPDPETWAGAGTYIFVVLVGLLIGGFVGIIVALFSGLILISC